MIIFRITNTLPDYFEKARHILDFPLKKGNFEPGLNEFSTVLIHIVTQYLEAHKRLVIPQLGTFIVKEPGRSILFSELLKRDDGVLRGLLRAEGLGELEAAGEIDRFAFEVRHAVQHGQEYRLEGFGVMKPGPNDTIAFVYEPRSAVASTGEKPGRGQQLQPEKVAEAVKTAFAEPRVSPSVKMNPDPSVRGLRYGRPPKSTDAYTYVDRPPRRRADRFIWIAVIAAVVALAAIAFGYWHEQREQRIEAEYLEAPSAPETAPAAMQPEQNE